VDGVEEVVVVCDDCGLGRFHPMLAPERVAELYPDEYYGEPGVKFQWLIEWLVRKVGERHIQFLSADLRVGARVLDIGCGRGVILGALASRNFEVHGVEMSAAAARGADPRAQIRIAPELRDAGYPDAHFDQVILWHVLEHLRDPRGTLQEIHRILRPGGRLIVAVPNFSSAQARLAGSAWFHLDLPRHLYHFPVSALRRILGELGYDTVSDHHFSLRQNPFGWIQSVANRIPGIPRNGIYALLHRRDSGDPPPYSCRERALLWTLLLSLAPFSLVACVIEALARTGATVHIVALRSEGGSDDDADRSVTRLASNPA
jgi:SAM-dependent methyltransferase